jgi:hypothetical protein
MDKKGFVLTFDLIMGITLVFIVIIFSTFFIIRSSETSLAQHSNLVSGADVVRILDQQKVFDSFDYGIIEQNMLDFLPGNLEMLLRLEGDFTPGNGTLEVGAELSNEASSGQRVGVTDNGKYFKITYFIWEKKG